MEKFNYFLIKDIETKNLDNPIHYIGSDGGDYATSEDIVRANRAYLETHFKSTPDSLLRDRHKSKELRFSFKGADGKEYPTSAAVIEADRAYWDRVRKQDDKDEFKLFFIGMDGK
ncbi:MAG: hypothetical protein WC867_05260, partial [Candidatus Pacearchaeota archaeon]